jgi:ribonuclease HII
MEGLLREFNGEVGVFDIGVDEAGRGPMLGRVYSAAVVLPKDSKSFPYHLVKDSKRFSSAKKLASVAEDIRSHAYAWSVAFIDEQVVDSLNIRTATHQAMHKAIAATLHKAESASPIAEQNARLLVDGNDFRPFVVFQNAKGLVQIPHHCIEKGDGKYACIAAASILAKDARDNYIRELCEREPHLDEQYKLLSNKGYGTKAHMEGLRRHGVSVYHRKTFGLCAKLIRDGAATSTQSSKDESV